MIDPKTAAGADLHVSRQGASERHFLVPVDADLGEGALELVRIDGHRVAADPSLAAAYEISAEQAQAFHERAVADAHERLSAGLAAVTQLLGAARTGHVGPRPQSLDEAAGLGQGDDLDATRQLLAGLQRVVQLAQTDPEQLQALGREVAAQWEGTGVEGVAERLPQALRDGFEGDEEE